MRGNIFIKGLSFGIIVLLTSTAILPSLSGSQTQPITETNSRSAASSLTTTTLTFYIAGKTQLNKHTVTLTIHDAEAITTQFQTLRAELITHPSRAKTQQLEQQFLNILYEKNVVPRGVTRQELMSLLQPPTHSYTPPVKHPLAQYNFDGTEYMCTFLSWGEGTSGPIIILPRLIPIIELPIPRIYMHWTATDYAVTSCGALNSNKGFTAEGPQKGTAIGFWGIGFTCHFPPLANMYGLIGYALYAHVSADYMEYYPPNSPPEITGADPTDGQVNVPVTTSELRFQISDADSDPMSYNVTTSPDIGSGSGGLKTDGIYSIPVNGLQDLTTYTWHITVTDGKDTAEKTVTFTTEPVAPIISTPSPADGERHVPTELQQLQFTLQDFQGDTMDYTVETSPTIGSGSGTNVHNGTYTVAVSGLLNFTTYRWYVNATDGTHWTRKTFAFETFFPTQFDPFEHRWHYRKQLTISHTNIPEDLTNFPVLVSITDNDLKEKTQANGGDILFMNDTGFATRLNYEIEHYDGTTGTLLAWVNITQLSSNIDTTFYVYYGNPTTLSQQNPEKTWDAHYVAVWHCAETSGINVADSTANHFNATANSYTPVIAGRLGNGRYFDMTHSEIYVGAQSAFGGMTSYTVEAWADPKSMSGEHRIFDRSGQNNPNTILFYQNNALLHLYTNNVDYCSFTDAFTVDTWTHTVGVFTGSGGESVVYNNGVKGIPIMTTQANPTAGSFTIYIGRACLSSSSSYRWYGTLDEIRFSNIARSSTWINVSYQNQHDPASFLNIGPEVPGP